MLRLFRLWSACLLLSLPVAAPAYQPDNPYTQFESQLAFLRPPPVYSYPILFGSRPRGLIDFQPARRTHAPLIIALSGYGPGEPSKLSASWLPARFYEEGFAFASISHERGVGAGFSEIVGDMILGLRRTMEEAERKGIDTSRIVLYGGGTSAHLAALFATDPSYLDAAGIPFGAVKSVLLIEGRNFDLPKTFAEASRFKRSWLKRVVGENPAEWERLSPTLQLAPPNAPHFIVLNPKSRDAAAEAEAFAARLRAAAIPLDVLTVANYRPQLPQTVIGSPPHEGTKRLIELISNDVRPEAPQAD